MFTGIVEEIGTVQTVSTTAEACKLAILAQRVVEDVQLGDSIAVNGICLTVTSFHKHGFTADAVPETVRRTTLSQLKAGDPINLERAMRADGRFGGHFVTGHIDGTAVLTGKRQEGSALILSFAPEREELLKYILPKGSVALDGISLTVMDVSEAEFRISVIPHTLAKTTLHGKKPGEKSNLECDMLGKYIERFLLYREERQKKTRLDQRFLQEHGFI
ncbi:riboflavin synthase [Brevibacillus massiliensis]|jgi:riboflavin synthase|uniref:riboflavin synthase n=1 Tax=Brevibacillus massiliensis TaxID=1118054 RepID=UPI0002EACBFC|nr:riboflavin synthase [Brevibacillus massiliensis]